jgi:tRNA (adenine37-N6)-methyltransferase
VVEDGADGPTLVKDMEGIMLSFEITPIGTVQNARTDVQHTDNWGAVRSTITVEERFGDACLQGLDGFSHVEILFVFDQFPDHGDYREPRPNRGRPDLPPVGVFAGRGPRRPNRIGVTCCAIESVHGRELTVVGLDAVSGTPVIDLKPVMAEFLPENVKQPEWVSRLMSEYFQP